MVVGVPSETRGLIRDRASGDFVLRPGLWPCSLPLLGSVPQTKSPCVRRAIWRQCHHQAMQSTGRLAATSQAPMGIPPSLPLFQDLDDMDADLLGLKKSDPASSKRAAKGSGKEELPSHPKSASLLTASEKGEWERAPGVWTFWGLGRYSEGSCHCCGFSLRGVERPFECLWWGRGRLPPASCGSSASKRNMATPGKTT